jgi:hypothetical protein
MKCEFPIEAAQFVSKMFIRTSEGKKENALNVLLHNQLMAPEIKVTLEYGKPSEQST